jgi:hypothetical protein
MLKKLYKEQEYLVLYNYKDHLLFKNVTIKPKFHKNPKWNRIIGRLFFGIESKIAGFYNFIEKPSNFCYSEGIQFKINNNFAVLEKTQNYYFIHEIVINPNQIHSTDVEASKRINYLQLSRTDFNFELIKTLVKELDLPFNFEEFRIDFFKENSGQLNDLMYVTDSKLDWYFRLDAKSPAVAVCDIVSFETIYNSFKKRCRGVKI